MVVADLGVLGVFLWWHGNESITVFTQPPAVRGTCARQSLTRLQSRYFSPPVFNGSPSAGAYPEHVITGSRGYFANRESDADNKQR